MRRVFLRFALSLALLAAAPADAQELRASDERMIRDEAHRARIWRYSWMGINAALMIGSFVAAPLVEEAERPDWVVSGAGSAINFAACGFWPLRVESAEEELDALPRAERARRARRLVLESAEDEQGRVAWPWHLVNFTLSALAGSILALGYSRYESGVFTAIGGTVLGSTQILTQPTNLQSSFVSGPTGSRVSLSPRFTLLHAPDLSLRGAALSITGVF